MSKPRPTVIFRAHPGMIEGWIMDGFHETDDKNISGLYNIHRVGSEESHIVKFRLEQLEDKTKNEIELYRRLQAANRRGFATLVQYGKFSVSDYIIMTEDASETMIDLQERMPNQRFGRNQTFTFAASMMRRLMFIHSEGFVHGDVTLPNFLVAEDFSIFLVGLGHCQNTHAIQNNQLQILKRRKQDKTENAVRGSLMYASGDVNQGYSTIIRDDLISVCYCIIKMISGSLPWEELCEAENASESLDAIVQMKNSIEVLSLFEGAGELKAVYSHILSLGEGDVPLYERYIGVFQRIAAEAATP